MDRTRMYFSRKFILIYLIIMLASISPVEVDGQEKGITTEVVFLGDSITEGLGKGDESYVNKLPEFGEPWNSDHILLRNLGVAGRQARYYTQNGLPSNLIDSDFSGLTYIVVQLGTNDLNYLNNPDLFDTAYHALLGDLVSLNPEPQEIFTLQFPWFNFTKDYVDYNSFFQGLNVENISHYESIISQYQAIIKNVSLEFGFQSVDLWEITENHRDYYIDDEVHLNALGAQTIAEKIHNELGSQISVIPPDTSEQLHFPSSILVLATAFFIICMLKSRSKKIT
ncbi:MAG: SGNH/GDSL hydrolase family protein [Candidatus Heimdallarchaeota archaeon]